MGSEHRAYLATVPDPSHAGSRHERKTGDARASPTRQGQPESEAPDDAGPEGRCHGSPADMAWMRGPGPYPTCVFTSSLACEPLAGAWSKSLGLTFIFFSACRPGWEAGTGRFYILREVIHVPVEKARK